MAVLGSFLAICLPTMYTYESLSQNCNSGSHFEVLRGRNLNWYKSKKCKKHTQKRKKRKGVFFLQNRKNTEMKKFAYCVVTFEPI